MMKIIKSNLSYIDFRVLAILLALMIIVAGIRETGFFDMAVNRLLSVVKNTRQLAVSLSVACFFVSMLMTNDVALITFVPFAIMVIEKAKKRWLLIRIVVFQTIAANLGSMLTPIGNPQNLYLYSKSGMGLGEFFGITLPYTMVALILLMIACFVFVKQEDISVKDMESDGNVAVNKAKLFVYVVLFLVAIGSVLHILDYRLMLLLVLIVVAALNYKLIFKADYKLLLTFIILFLIIGNVKNISVVSDFISKYVKGNEIVWGVVLSQVISNVPAAMLLAGFTDSYKALIIGTNLGGLGTLIASMASLISYKAYVGVEDSDKKKYILEFSIFNVAFLIILGIMAWLMN